MILEAQQATISTYKANFSSKALPIDYMISGTALSASSASPTFSYPKTENWQKAIGAHIFWISADIHAEKTRTGKISFETVMTTNIEDMYNFNPSQKDIATGIPDSENGRLATSGLARQYLNYSQISKAFSWEGLSAGTKVTVKNQPTRRTRQSSDNRRIRNRL